MRAHAYASAACLLLSVACAAESGAPRPEWVVTASTDAPVPRFGNRLLIEVSSEGGDCGGRCRRLFPVSDSADFPISFGVAPTADTLRTTIRARLFRDAIIGSGGEPTGPALIDLLGELPAAPPEGVLRVALPLAMRCFGQASDPAARSSCDPTLGTVTSALALEPQPDLSAGSWSAAFDAACLGPSPPGMICVQAGAYLFGDPTPDVAPAEEVAVPERLVTVSPFYLDAREVSVGDFRQLAQSTSLPLPLSQGPQGSDTEFCTFLGLESAAADGLPLNCLTRGDAREVCKARGLRLPSEVEWEWAAGDQANESPYPWGQSSDVCAHAVIARSVATEGAIQCRDTPAGTLPPGPAAVGTVTDATSLGLYDLGGNVAEWVEDDFSPRSGKCWAPGKPALNDPICAVGDGSARQVARGGSWRSPPGDARPRRRRALQANSRWASVGFRCAGVAVAAPQ